MKPTIDQPVVAERALLEHIIERVRLHLELPESSRDKIREILIACGEGLAIEFGGLLK